jgi:hypothetical protein
MALHLFVFLLVVCLFFFLALLWRLDWLHLQPSHAQGGAKRSTLHRMLKPRCPDDCPDCRLASTRASGGGLASTPVRPWREVKSRRGGCCHWWWWIIRQAPCKLISGCFLFIRPSRQTPSPCSLHPCLLSSSPSRPPPFARRLLHAKCG